MKRFAFGIASLLLVAAIASPAAADTFFFQAITSNSSQVVLDAVEAQLSVDVTDEGGGKVRFTFKNSAAGTIDAFIDGVYFDDGTLLGISQVINSSGVDFSDPATPSDLPGGNAISPPFETTADFSADRDGGAANGVNLGEEVAVVFNLINGKTFADTIAAINGGVDLRLGVKVQGLPQGQSDGFVNVPPGPGPGPTPVPLPGVASAAIALLAGLGLTRRR